MTASRRRHVGLVALGFVMTVVVDRMLFYVAFKTLFAGHVVFSAGELARIAVAVEAVAGCVSVWAWTLWLVYAKYVARTSRRVAVVAYAIMLLLGSMAWGARVIITGQHQHAQLGWATYAAMVLGFRFVIPVCCCTAMAAALWKGTGRVARQAMHLKSGETKVDNH